MPAWQSALLAVASAVLMALAFPDFEVWIIAMAALVPLLVAVEREKHSFVSAFIIGWIFGIVFFALTCWWLTFAPITYAGFPVLLAYFLLLVASAGAGIFSAIFTAIYCVLLRRFGKQALFAVPFVWVFTEFLRYWLTGNNWNAIGYSQAFNPFFHSLPQFGGVLLTSFVVIFFNALWLIAFDRSRKFNGRIKKAALTFAPGLVLFIILAATSFDSWIPETSSDLLTTNDVAVIAIQPNVPMSGLSYQKWQQLRQRHVELAENKLKQLSQSTYSKNPTDITVIFPESPMNFMYDEDPETKNFINGFARRNNVKVLFNSAEPDKASGKYFNSAVMVSPQGEELVQYDKIFLVPFGESVPTPLQSIVPALVGSFAYGSEYDLFPLGGSDGINAGVMICFESHFGQLGREYVRRGADVLIEMTNDGYLGNTPILRQHLANAVFRALETDRPVLRVTNVGITAYIDTRGRILDYASVYQEDTRVWSVLKYNGSQTFYVRYGDWLSWLSSLVTLTLLLITLFHRKQQPAIK